MMIDILIIYDVPDWCLHFAAQGLKKYWQDETHVAIACQSDPDIQKKINHTRLVIAMCRGTFQKLKLDASRTLVAVGSHKLLPDKSNVNMLRSAAGVLCANEFLQSEWEKHLPHVHYCPIGFDPQYFYSLGSRPKIPPFTVGWAGNTRRPEKRFNEVVSPALSPLSDVKLLTATERYDFTPSASLREKLYNNLHLFIVASTSEGGPMPAVEAMACGVPVLSTRVGIMREIIKDGNNGWFFDGKIAGLRDKVFERMRHWDNYLSVRTRVTSAVKSFSWNRAVYWWEIAVKKTRRRLKHV